MRVNAKLIESNNILHLSADELERVVNQEQMQNPALEVTECRVCLFCGTQIYGQECTICGRLARTTRPLPLLYEQTMPFWEQQSFYAQQGSFDTDNYAFIQADSDDAYDPLAHISIGETVAEALLQELETLLSPADALIAEQLVGNLNERGYLEVSIQEIAEYLSVPLERVAYVLKQLQTLEPGGIGARDLRECLLIQLQALSTHETPHPLIHTLVDRYLEQVARNQFHKIVRDVKQSEQEIRTALLYIRSRLYPFPAYIYQQSTRYTQHSSGAAYIRPDIIIRSRDLGFEIELIEEKRYHFNIKTHCYIQQVNKKTMGNIQHYMQFYDTRAKLFIDCIQRRWSILKRITEFVIDFQGEFLEKGRRYLRVLTRAQVAEQLGLSEGTISRATANKYTLLPNGHLMAFADFFDGSLATKDILRNLIQAENPNHHLSDEELARLLMAQGIPLARRTVTKYREEMGIASSRGR
ncbi:MAG: RNA polymerase factor sigma-54 [Chloroflexi bacterium]|nr:RNA polymerase factor sigma-54 [Chloroflexota bacterium]